MNGIAERTIRTVVEHASAMLWAARLPIGFWSSAVKCSVFLMNRSPHSALQDNMTPYEAWFGRKPNLGFLRVFGCHAAAHVPDELRLKTSWTSKSSPNCIFIGYSDTENLFELWDVEKSTLIRKRDVVFWEHELGHPKLVSPLPHGVSILPAVASELVYAITPLRNVSIPFPPTPPNNIPLAPRAGRQKIDRLPSEPKSSVHSKDANYRFIPEQLNPEAVAKVSNIKSSFDQIEFVDDSQNAMAKNVHHDPPSPDEDQAHPPLPHSEGMLVAQYMCQIDVSDELFMEDYAADNWLEPCDSAMTVALGEVHPVEAYNVASSSKQLFIPYIDRDGRQTYKQAMSHPHKDLWKAAMDRELAALHTANTWELVDLPVGHRAFPNRWVFAYIRGPKAVELQEKIWKEQQNGVLTPDQVLHLQSKTTSSTSTSNEPILGKARLVARGDLQKEGVDYEQMFAPVVKFVSLRIILAWAARNHMHMRHWDITSAFLHGEIDMTVFMQQPQGYTDGTNCVCLLKKAIYGLHQSARQFYIKLDSVLADIGYQRLSAD